MTTTTTLKHRSIKDPIHDLVPISRRGWSFIDTRQFQRLRHLKQLGTSYTVWPGASHNRFEHCLGVGYLARLFAETLQRAQPELGITDREVECIEIAGLCHDLGHGPWSHVWDGRFMPVAKPGTTWTHEEGSEMMFDALIDENSIDITTEDRQFIKALIAGDPQRCPSEKPYLFQIVANKKNGLDVDKFDYILRDTYNTSDPVKLNIHHIIRSARVIKDQICYNIKDVNQIYAVCETRFRLHKMIYNHKTATAIEYMIIDALLSAEPYLKLSDRVNDPKKYVHLTDCIQNTIEESETPELAEAREIFDNIRARNLYKMADYNVISWHAKDKFEKLMTPEAIVGAVQRLLNQGDKTMPSQIKDAEGNIVETSTLTPRDVIVALSAMHYGMKIQNPLDFVEWYSNNDLNNSRKATPGDYSTLMPKEFGEVLLRVYTRNPIFYAVIQRGYREVLDDINKMEDTPPGSQKKPISRNASLASLASTEVDDPTPPCKANPFTTVSPEYVPQSPKKRKRLVSTPDSSRSCESLQLERPVSPSPKKRKAN